MAIDRDAALKTAEKLLRQGKLDGAIEEYVRLVEDQPRDWNSINALGDLYVRAGDTDRAVAQFTRIADHLFEEGFLPKAAALYKKALKVHSVHEPTLLRLGEIAGRQGLLADAKTYFRQLAEQRRVRGDTHGAAECIVRLGTLDDADAELKLAAARAAQQMGDNGLAASLLKQTAEELEKQNRRPEALELLVDAAQLDPGDLGLRARLARECVDAGQLDRARLFLTRESAGDDPGLLLSLAHVELSSGKDQEARAVLIRLLIVAPDRQPDVIQLAAELVKNGHPERAFGCIDVVTDAALLEGDLARAADTLHGFVRHVPYVPALMKLVEVCVDAGLDALMREAQAQLADAYLTSGRGAEARVIAEDLVDYEPESAAHVQRLRHALQLLGVEDVDAAIAGRLHPDADAGGLSESLGDLENLEIVERIEIHEPERGAERDAPGQPASMAPPVDRADVPLVLDDAIVLEAMEIDLSSALADIGAAVPVKAPQAAGATAPPAGPPQDLESVFEEIRTRVARDHQEAGASDHYDRGLEHLRAGREAEGIADLQAAAREPHFRFLAAAQLGRLHIGRSDLHAGVDWLERAAEAPAPVPDDGYAVLYDLATALERLGESARALAILMELDADAGGYRDVRSRIERLTREQAGSRGA